MPLDVTWPPNSIVPPGGTSGAYDNLTVTGTFTAPGTFVIPGTFSPSSLSIPGTSALNGGGALVGTFSGSPVFSGTPSLSNGAAFTGTFSGNPTFSGNLTHQGTSALNGATTVGTNSAAASLISNGPAGTARVHQWSTAGSSRWRMQANATAESGSNAGSDMDLFGFSDAGSSLGSVLRITRSSGTFTWNPSLSYSDPIHSFHGSSITVDKTIAQAGTHTYTTGVAPGTGGLSPLGVNLNVTFTGTLDTGGNPHFNYWQVTDTVNAARALTASAQLAMVHHYNAGASGDRWQLAMTYNKAAAALDGLTTSAMNLFVAMQYDVTEGVGTSSRASVCNFDGRVGGTGGHVGRLLIQENDVRLFSGNTADSKGNIVTNNGIGDAAHGTFEDFAYAAGSSPTIAPGTGGNKTIFQLGFFGGTLPWDPNLSGTALMQVYFNREANLTFGWQPTLTYGFDLRGLLFSSNPWRSPGHEIDGGGQIPILGPGAITFSASGIKIATPNVYTTGATIAAGGSGYKLNEYTHDTMGNIWKITGVTGSTVTAVTLQQTNYASAAPANPVSTLSGNGTGLTLNLTTSATGTLTLGDTGQTVNIATGTLKVGAAQMTANGSVATAMSNLGPAGSHTTIQEWLTVTNSAGTVRYIPCF